VAGIIVLKSGDWNISSGGFCAMATGVMRHLADNQAALAIKDALVLAVDSQLYFLDASDSFTEEMLREFKEALDLHLCDATAQDVQPLDNPDLHRGYLNRLHELQQMINQSLT
jgi:hypothetical protein